MNGFKTLVFLHSMPTKSDIVKETKKCMRVWDFVKSCDLSDIVTLFDTGVFRKIIIAYVETSLKSLVRQRKITPDAAAYVHEEVEFFLNSCCLRDICGLLKEFEKPDT